MLSVSATASPRSGAPGSVTGPGNVYDVVPAASYAASDPNVPPLIFDALIPASDAIFLSFSLAETGAAMKTPASKNAREIPSCRFMWFLLGIINRPGFRLGPGQT